MRWYIYIRKVGENIKSVTIEVDYLFRGRTREEKGNATKTQKLVSVFKGTTSWITEKVVSLVGIHEHGSNKRSHRVEIKKERKRNLNNMGGIFHRCQ